LVQVTAANIKHTQHKKITYLLSLFWVGTNFSDKHKAPFRIKNYGFTPHFLGWNKRNPMKTLINKDISQKKSPLPEAERILIPSPLLKERGQG
jgi:hypothetical protein